MANQKLFLFTKKFPYGHQETYLFDEVPYLIEKFKNIIIIPYDEYDYNEDKNRLAGRKQIKVFKINKEKLGISISEKIKREVQINLLILKEILFGREKIKHVKRYKGIASQLRHLYLNAKVLSGFISQFANKDERVVFYNYWLHRGVIVSYFAKQHVSNPVKIFSRAHAYDLYHNDWLTMLNVKTNMFLPLEYCKIQMCDRIFSISEHGLNHFYRFYPGFKSRFSVARLGVKDNMSDNTPVEKDTKLIISCSAIDDRKRIYLMPEILSKLNFKFRWIHIGGGSIENISKVEDQIKKYKLENSCELKGMIPHHEIIEFYKNTQVDYFFNLSTAEGIPVSLMEASSFGTPMIATDTIGNPEIVNNQNGFLISVNFNADDIANAINSYNSKNSEIQNKRRASRETFLTRYNASKNYLEFGEILSGE